MTDKEKLEKLKKLADAMYYAAQHLTTDASMLHKAMDEYHKFIIHECKEEPASEDFETAAERYASNTADLDIVETRYRSFIVGANWQKAKDQSIIELAEDHAMLAGMEKMKEQMMTKAIDAVVKMDAGGYPYIPQMELNDYDKDIPLAKKGDKYKVILIKED